MSFSVAPRAFALVNLSFARHAGHVTRYMMYTFDPNVPRLFFHELYEHSRMERTRGRLFQPFFPRLFHRKWKQRLIQRYRRSQGVQGSWRWMSSPVARKTPRKLSTAGQAPRTSRSFVIGLVLAPETCTNRRIPGCVKHVPQPWPPCDRIPCLPDVSHPQGSAVINDIRPIQ